MNEFNLGNNLPFTFQQGRNGQQTTSRRLAFASQATTSAQLQLIQDLCLKVFGIQQVV